MALRALDRVRNRLSRPTDAARVARINHRWAFCRGTAVFDFALTNVPPATAAVSAKTDWNLRRKLAVTFDSNGLAVANFTSLTFHGRQFT
jgi:hypothetical protein